MKTYQEFIYEDEKDKPAIDINEAKHVDRVKALEPSLKAFLKLAFKMAGASKQEVERIARIVRAAG